MSSESDSDEDYVPGKPEQLSEEESADDEIEAQFEEETEQKNKRKTLTTQKNCKRRRTSTLQNKKPDSDSEKAEAENNEDELDLEEQKKKDDDLWASFLGDTPKPKVTSTVTDSIKQYEAKSVKVTLKQTKDTKEDLKNKEARIFEFAGEKVVVENNVIKEVVTANTSTSPAVAAGPLRSRGSGGLSNLLGQLNKKNKLSTLEKTKLDWDTFKMKEGLDEEIQNHNKGKDGYLEKQDFLERADLRQFEIERELRTSRRSNR